MSVWIKMYEKTPPVGEDVELKVIYNGEERIYVNRLMATHTGIYKWVYCDYDDCDKVVAWRSIVRH